MVDSLGWFILVLAVLVGASFGSFIEAAVTRRVSSLRELSVGSHCDTCGFSIPWYLNLPLISWPLLRGKCSRCHSGIPVRTWLVELGGAIGAFSITLTWILENTYDLLFVCNLLTLLLLFFTTLAIALWDWRYSRIPNILVIIGLLVIYLGLSINVVISGQWQALEIAAIGSISYSIVLLAVRLAKPGGMGMGDVKLALVLGGAAASWSIGNLFVAFFMAFAMGAVFGLALIGTGKASRQSKIPFGPWMVIGLWFSFFFGSQIWAFYLEVIASVV